MSLIPPSENSSVRLLAPDEASITAPLGWSAGAVVAGIKTYGESPRFDLGLLVSDRPCTLGAVFTRNKVCGAPVTVSREVLQRGTARAIVCNSGCSNVAMGERGVADAREMARLAGAHAGVDAESVIVGSTGVIGRPLPMQKIRDGMSELKLSADSGAEFSRSIMTTDTVPKTRAAQFSYAGKTYTVAGTAKGSGMSHPDMATVFCFLTTDAKLSGNWLQGELKRVADVSVNMVDVDMDTSTSDMMLVLANGAQGGPDLSQDPAASKLVREAMERVSIALAKDLARDGEGAKTLIEVRVTGAATHEEARAAARTVVSSPLVKTMVTGRDANLGRVLMALGRSGAALELEKLCVWLNEHQAFRLGEPTELPIEQISKEMARDTVRLSADLGLGAGSATAWGCDLTEEYVRINADYTT